MKTYHFIILGVIVFACSCNAKNRGANCSALIQATPMLELQRDTLYDIVKYEVRANLADGCPIDHIRWVFLKNDDVNSFLEVKPDAFVLIPHRLTYDEMATVQLNIFFSDGGSRVWHFPIVDVVKVK